MQVPFQFTDVRPYDNTDTYECTNEQLPRLTELTSMVNPKIAGAIASGGEVPLGVMLLQPNIEQCVAIDQAYGSLKWAYLKAMVIHLCTPDEAHKHLSHASPSYSYNDTFPQDLRDKLALVTPATLKTTFRAAGPDYWAKHISVADVATIKANLHKLHLVHGDIRDLPQFSDKRYDIIYLSNATSKTNYAGHGLKLEHFENIVGKWGHILTTGSDQLTDKWRERLTLGYDPSIGSGSSWNYSLLQLNAQESRTFERQSWEHLRSMKIAELDKRTAPKYIQTTARCTYCKTTRRFNFYTDSSLMSCYYCGYRIPVPPPLWKLAPLYDRYPIKVA